MGIVHYATLVKSNIPISEFYGYHCTKSNLTN